VSNYDGHKDRQHGSTANNIDHHAVLEGEMVTRVSKTRDPLSANGKDSSGDALLHTRAWCKQHNAQADARRPEDDSWKRQTQKTLTMK
jgi:hypothetical protein